AMNLEKIKDVVKPYDWTFSTEYAGTVESDSSHQFEPTDEGPDIERLKLPEPILFYDQLVLFEDELADNGTAILNVRVRVMPSCFLVLLRYFLRVDEVLFRIHDTRIYHQFGSAYMLREFSASEHTYSFVKDKLPKPAPWEPNRATEDLSLLTDSNWVASVLPSPYHSSHTTSSASGDADGAGGKGKKKEVAESGAGRT
ncbi:hypothetical protein HK102_011012, partial [Quaeritorhiza haematococci]